MQTNPGIGNGFGLFRFSAECAAPDGWHLPHTKASPVELCKLVWRRHRGERKKPTDTTKNAVSVGLCSVGKLQFPTNVQLCGKYAIAKEVRKIFEVGSQVCLRPRNDAARARICIAFLRFCVQLCGSHTADVQRMVRQLHFKRKPILENTQFS